MFVNIMQRFHQFRQHRRLLTVYFNIPLSPEKKKAQILQYTFVCQQFLKKLFILHSFSLPHPHTHIILLKLHIYTFTKTFMTRQKD